ncbi:MAG: prolipoprotein diacylglyceryl transferase [Proteobacteria bacterium]|nr:prolipoprotein diacylglyceryl transferase [Pseudomonadota bacterium]
MLNFPDIDPVIFSLGPLKLHWYGLMYAIGFLAFWGLAHTLAKKEHTVVQPDDVDDLFFYGMLGVVIGGRLGSVLFYNFSYFLGDPLYLFRIWEGGMSFHGGLLGVIVVLWVFHRKKGCSFLHLCDFVAPAVPVGLGAGRIGNFINGELWGRATDVPWGMVFPGADALARHPSQLYQAFLEGLVLFVVLWLFVQKPRPVGSVAGLFMLLYGVFRFMVEFVREPDMNLGFIAFDWMTMGQLLTVPMILVGLALMYQAYRKSGAPRRAH